MTKTNIDTRARIPSQTRGDPREADRRLRRNAERYTTSGRWLLLVGVVAAAIGGAMALIGSAGSWLVAAGVMIAWVAAVPTCAGIALLLSAVVSAWAGRRRPFA